MRSFKTIVSLNIRKANKRLMMDGNTIIYYIQKQKKHCTQTRARKKQELKNENMNKKIKY